MHYQQPGSCMNRNGIIVPEWTKQFIYETCLNDMLICHIKAGTRQLSLEECQKERGMMGYKPQTLGEMSWCCEGRSHALQIALLTGVYVHLEVQNTITNDQKNSIYECNYGIWSDKWHYWITITWKNLFMTRLIYMLVSFCLHCGDQQCNVDKNKDIYDIMLYLFLCMLVTWQNFQILQAFFYIFYIIMRIFFFIISNYIIHHPDISNFIPPIKYYNYFRTVYCAYHRRGVI